MAVVTDWDLTEPPQRIDQVAAFRPGQVTTAAEINEYINLLISQGNYNTAWLVMIAEKLTNGLIVDINTQLDQITIDIETMYGTQTAEMQAIVAQIDAAVDQAVLDMKAAVADTNTQLGRIAIDIETIDNLYDFFIYDWNLIATSVHSTGWMGGYYRADGTPTSSNFHLRTLNTPITFDDLTVSFTFTPPKGYTPMIHIFDGEGNFIEQVGDSAGSDTDPITLEVIKGYGYKFTIGRFNNSDALEYETEEFTNQILLEYKKAKVDILKETYETSSKEIFQYRGLFSDIERTSFLECTDVGFYYYLAEDIGKITDLPEEHEKTGGLLEVFVDALGCKWQRITQQKSIFVRFLYRSGAIGTWNYFKSEQRIFKSLTISIMSDSLSSYKGYVPDGNTYYYPKNGVSEVSQMWWSVMNEALGTELLVNNSWSGSCCASGVRTDTVEASAESRCANGLGTDEKSPSIILVGIGGNDYSYDCPLGNWDGTTAPVDTTTFKEAYAVMLNRMQQNYPSSLIVCLTPWYLQRGTDNGVTYLNELGLNKDAYSNAIKDVASIFNVPVIDIASLCGFNRYNYYAADGSAFCQDSNSEPTHPNANGQKVIGLTIAEELKKLCNGYINHLN